MFDIMNHMIHDQTTQYTWEGAEYEHLEKTTDWYWGLGIVVVTGIVIAIISKNYLMVILLAVGGIMLAIYANDRPDPVHVEISERGIKLNQELYLFETIQSFWMYRDHKNHDQIIIVTGRKIMPQRIVSLPDDIPATELRSFLLRFITEKEAKPTIIDTLAGSFGL
ncbi:hypothetical protein EBR96_07045 [bacterium]|nr:hypothetical protein [bacterium]